MFVEYNAVESKISEGLIDVGDEHKLFYHEYGNKDGKAFVVIHGGPGSRSKESKLKFFDLSRDRVILYDQRGCGNSTPFGEIENNTTNHLINDLEVLRKELKIDKWSVVGSSWGSTLSLLYTQEYPEKVDNLILSNVFLARKESMKWMFEGSKYIYPELHQYKNKLIKECGLDKEDFSNSLFEYMNKGEKEAIQGAVLLANFEGNVMGIENSFNFVTPDNIDEAVVSGYKIFTEFEVNNFWIEDNQILKNASKLDAINVFIVHGRYDIICPLKEAWDLHNALTNSDLEIINYEGHRDGFNSIQTIKKIVDRLY